MSALALLLQGSGHFKDLTGSSGSAEESEGAADQGTSEKARGGSSKGWLGCLLTPQPGPSPAAWCRQKVKEKKGCCRGWSGLAR